MMSKWPCYSVGILLRLGNNQMSLKRVGKNPYLIAVFSVAAAAAVRLALDPLLHQYGVTVLFTCGIVIAALYAGLRAGISATILSTLVVEYVFVEPRYSLALSEPRPALLGLGLFAVLGISISLVIEQFRKTRERLREAKLEAEKRESMLTNLAATVPEILFTADADGQADYVSRRFYDYTGQAPGAKSAQFWETFHADDRAMVAQNWTKAIQSKSEFLETARLRRFDGQYRWFQVHAKPVRDAEGRVAQWAGVASDIHEEKMLEGAVAAAHGDFQKFAYRVAHDLKEPLRAIGIYSEMLALRAPQNDEESRLFARHVLGGVEQVEKQIDNLLEYARAGFLEVTREPVDLNGIAASAIANLQPHILETGGSVTHDALPVLTANPERMRSVFQNLIGNALKYRGDRAPRIHISARESGKEWIFVVEDNGIGFEMKDAERIFEPFERGSAGSKVQGTGLGLAIVKRIVEMDGGRIWAESQKGQGSRFCFTLPTGREKKGPVAEAEDLRRVKSSGSAG